jgi:hypothetical protein
LFLFISLYFGKWSSQTGFVQRLGKNGDNVKTENKSFADVAEFKHFRTTEINQDVKKEVTSRLNSGNTTIQLKILSRISDQTTWFGLITGFTGRL